MNEIKNNLSIKKAPELDLIKWEDLKQLPQKAFVKLTNILNNKLLIDPELIAEDYCNTSKRRCN